MIAIGARVFLKACRCGLPGVVIRQERSRLVVYWPDMDHFSRHVVASLMEIAPESPEKPPQFSHGQEVSI